MKKRKKRRIPKKFKNYFYYNSDGKLVKKETAPEKKTRKILQSLNLKFNQEYEIYFTKTNGKVIKKVYDFYVKDEVVKDDGTYYSYDFFIECHGDHWHYAEGREPAYFNLKRAKKRNYRKKKPNRTQIKNMRNDKKKEAISKIMKIPLIIVWEYELNNYPNVVKKRIQDMVNKQIQVYYA